MENEETLTQSPVPVETAPEATPETIAAPAIIAEPKVSASDFAKFKAKADRLRQQEAEYKGYQSQATQLKNELESAKALAKSDPVAFAEKFGLDYNELIYRMSGAADDPQAKVAREIETLKARLEAKEKAEQQSAIEDHWESQFTAFASVIEANPELELLQKELRTNQDGVYDTLQTIATNAANQKITLTFEEAAQRYEQHLFDQLSRYKGAKKLKDLFPEETAPPKTEEAPIEAAKTEAAPAKTLNNNSSAEPSAAKKSNDGLSDRQRKIVEEEERLEAIVRALKARR